MAPIAMLSTCVRRPHHRHEINSKATRPKDSTKDKPQFSLGFITLTTSAMIAMISAALAVNAYDRVSAAASLAA
jgi:hypothetical protein